MLLGGTISRAVAVAITLSLSLVVPLAHAGPTTNFTCVCESRNLNGCAQAYSCRLNTTTIDFNQAAKVPDWVTDAEEALFVNTIDDAVNGMLRPPFYTLGRMTWEATVACDDDDGVLTWLPQQSQCKTTRITRGNGSTTSSSSRRRYHGWASLGFHPLGKEPGTWLTQILGEMDDPLGDNDTSLTHATCADTGLYMSVDYINSTQPYDPRFSPMGSWGMLYLQGATPRTYPVGAAGVPSYRTDADLINYGVDLDCTGFDTSGRVCQEPKCYEPPNKTHYECPMRNGTVGGGNCSRRYAANADDSGADSRSAGSVAWVVAAGVLAVGLGIGM